MTSYSFHDLIDPIADGLELTYCEAISLLDDMLTGDASADEFDSQ